MKIFLFILCTLFVPSIAVAGWEEQLGTAALNDNVRPTHTDQFGISITTGRFQNIWKAWGGGVWDASNNALVIWGGGHGDSPDNSVYKFSHATQLWTNDQPWVEGPVDGLGVIFPTNTAVDASVGLSPASPVSRHTYGNLVYLPAENGRTNAQMWIFGGSRAGGSGSFGRDVWTYDFVTKAWTQHTSTASPGANAPFATAGFAHYDATNNQVAFVTGTSGFLAVQFWDLTTLAWTPKTTWTYALGGLFANEYASTWVPDDHATHPRKIVVWGKSKIVLIDIDNLAQAPEERDAEVSCADAAVSRGSLAYHPPSGKLVMWNGGYPLTNPTLSASHIWAYDLLTNHCKLLDDTGGPPDTVLVSGSSYGRFQWMPSVGKFIANAAADYNVFYYNPTTLTDQLIIPDNMMIRFDMPFDSTIAPCGAADCPMKHMRFVPHPTDHKFYAFGGDHAGDPGISQSGRSEVYSYDVGTNTWARESPLCLDGVPQVWRSDETPWFYREVDGLFHYIPGLTQANYAGECSPLAGPSPAIETDWGTYNSSTAAFTAPGLTTPTTALGISRGNLKVGIYDAIRDRVYIPYSGILVYKFATDTWTKTNDIGFGTLRPEKSFAFIDTFRDKLVMFDPLSAPTGRMIRVNLSDVTDATNLDCDCYEVTNIPQVFQEGIARTAYMADSDKYFVFEIRDFTLDEVYRVHIYDPVTNTWEIDKTLDFDSTKGSVIFQANMSFYNPYHNVVALWGTPSNSTWLYRYGQSTSVPPPPPSSPTIPLPPTNLTFQNF